MAKDFMYQAKTIELDKDSTVLSGNFNDCFLDMVDRKVILVIGESTTSRDKVKVYVQIGDFAFDASVMGTATAGTTTDYNTGATIAYRKYDLTAAPVSKIMWGSDVLTGVQTVAIQFLGGTF